MIRNKFTLELRNELTTLVMNLDSAAAIEGAKVTTKEREELKKMLKKARDYVDRRILI
jgi:hypothetical protein